jgi:hypothetical protein
VLTSTPNSLSASRRRICLLSLLNLPSLARIPHYQITSTTTLLPMETATKLNVNLVRGVKNLIYSNAINVVMLGKR